jgi:hypothetical protein
MPTVENEALKFRKVNLGVSWQDLLARLNTTSARVRLTWGTFWRMKIYIFRYRQIERSRTRASLIRNVQRRRRYLGSLSPPPKNKRGEYTPPTPRHVSRTFFTAHSSLDGNPGNGNDNVHALLLCTLPLVAECTILFVVPVGADSAVHAPAAVLLGL